ncbi:hypothetical protein [Persicobacter diffluens]|uniref:hypothetical protein n=1 Tax=Persicobacter diffluens TaxID=981 RepID=UPI0030C737F8
MPLEEFLGENEEREKKYPFFKLSCSTALWRGYQGLWKLENNELFLIDVFLCASKERSLFRELFDSESPIRANWFTGDLFIQHGKMIKYHHSGFERYFEEETKVNIVQGSIMEIQHFVNGYQASDMNFPSNPDSIMAEVHNQINWKALPKLSKDYKVFVNIKMGVTDSLTIIHSKAPELYVQEVQSVLNEFPKLRKFYSRDEPLEEEYTFPVIFSNAQRKRFAH